MNPMFDITKPAVDLIDTDRLVRILEANPDHADRQFQIENWIAAQNRSAKHIVAPMATDTTANVIAMETLPMVTTEEFATLFGTFDLLTSGTATPEQIAEDLAGLAPILAKLKSYSGAPSLQTCFDAKGFPGDVLEIVPELADYETQLHLEGHIRVVRKPQPPTNENE